MLVEVFAARREFGVFAEFSLRKFAFFVEQVCKLDMSNFCCHLFSHTKGTDIHLFVIWQLAENNCRPIRIRVDIFPGSYTYSDLFYGFDFC